MKTLEKFKMAPPLVPLHVSWQIGDLMEFRGKQELFTRQVPQRLKALREHALIESAVSSNRIEGVMVEQKRIRPLLLGVSAYKDRNEEEIAGYRKVLDLIHSEASDLPISEKNILKFHSQSRGHIWDAGKYKEKPVDIVEFLPNGERFVRFRSVSPEQTPVMMKECLVLMDELRKDSQIHPLILLSALNLDFLCIHPFRDGNGRVSRLLLLQTCYHLGLEVGRYVSLERIIEQNKDRYYETLKLSSQGWHTGQHDPWHYISYLLFVLKQAFQEFEERVGQIQAPRGAKMDMVLSRLQTMPCEFTLQQVEMVCPGVGRDWIKSILNGLKQEGKVSCSGRGRGARWKYHKE